MSAMVPLADCPFPANSQKTKSPALRGFLYGAGTKSRTRDLLITSQLLYQLSYTGEKMGAIIAIAGGE